MTENAPIEDRTANIREVVEHIINRKTEEMFEQFDRLHRRNIHDDDVIAALRHYGDIDLVEGYADWAEIDLREDDNTTTDPTVPDPADSPSYALHSLRMQLAGPGTVVETIEQLALLRDGVILMDRSGRAIQIVRNDARHDLKVAGWDEWENIMERDDDEQWQIVDARRRIDIENHLPATILGGAK